MLYYANTVTVLRRRGRTERAQVILGFLAPSPGSSFQAKPPKPHSMQTMAPRSIAECRQTPWRHGHPDTNAVRPLLLRAGSRHAVRHAQSLQSLQSLQSCSLTVQYSTVQSAGQPSRTNHALSRSHAHTLTRTATGQPAGRSRAALDSGYFRGLRSLFTYCFCHGSTSFLLPTVA